MQFFKQKCHQKKKTHFFAFMQKTSREAYRIGILDAETRKKDEEKAFLAQVEKLPHNTDIQYIK